jgi:hypothetical protein
MNNRIAANTLIKVGFEFIYISTTGKKKNRTMHGTVINADDQENLEVSFKETGSRTVRINGTRAIATGTIRHTA